MGKHNLFVDSSQRRTGTSGSTDFTVVLTKPVKRAQRCYLYDVAIPFSYYVFPSGSLIDIAYFDGVGFSSFVVVIPEGNYTITEILALLNADVSVIAANITFTVGAANKIVMTTTTVGGFVGVSSVTNAWRTLGFTQAVPAASASITADNVYNLSGPNRLYIHSYTLNSVDTLKTNTLFTRGTSYTNIIGSVVVDVNSGGLIRSLVPNPSLLLYGRDISEIDFSLRFSDGTLVDLNGLEWSLQLCIESA